MPEFIANWVVSHLGTSAVGAGLSTKALLTIGSVVESAAELALVVAANALLAPSVPSPEAGKFSVKQSIPPRRYGFGKIRVSGPFMLRESRRNVLYMVIALPEGPVGHFGRYWLHDDEVTVTGGVVDPLQLEGALGPVDGAYGHDSSVEWQTRLGLATETAYADLVAEWPEVWPATARGDGVPSMYVRSQNGKWEHMPRDFPHGIVEPSVEIYYLAYDWRDEAQDRADPTTWAESANPVVGAVNMLWRRYGADWDLRFAPVLDLLTIEADYCDELVDLAGSGAEPRYACGLWWEATNPCSAVLAQFLESMDGWFGQRWDGAYIIRAGRYAAPTVTFGDAEIWDWSFDPGPTPDAVTNVLALSYTSPAHRYTAIETDPWRDEASIAALGEEKVQPYYPQSVQSNGQVRRLAKRKMSKLAAGRGQIRTPLSARRGLGQRFIGVSCSETDDLAAAVLEIEEAEVDLASASITWTYLIADPDIDDWDPETEEGAGPGVEERPPAEPLEAPDVTGVIPYYESAGEGGAGVRLHISALGPDRDDLTWFYRVRTAGETSYEVREITDTDPAANFEGDSGFVPAGELEFQLAYQTGSGALSPYGPEPPFEVDATVPTPGNLAFDLPSNSGLLVLLEDI